MVETISREQRKARKTHTCDYCGGKIEVGEVYDYSFCKFDDVYSWKAHLKCVAVADELWDYIDPLEGMTEDDFFYGCQDFSRTFVCPDCEYWDAGECEKDESFCVNKMYDFLQTHSFRQIKPGVWKCFPETGGVNNG